MNKFIISVLTALSVAVLSYAQPAPAVNPAGITQELYIDSTGHTVPYALATPRSGLTAAVFDPSTSSTDQAAAFGHAQRTWSSATTGSQPLQLLVLPGIVNNNIQTQETRTAVPFSIGSSTTLTTIPFTFPTYLQTNGHYRFVARLYINAAGGGTKIDVGGTCNTSNFVAEYQAFTTTTMVYGGQLTSFLSGPSGSSTASQTFILITGELDVTNGGSFVIQFAQNASNASNSTVLAGSTFTVTQIP